MGRGIATFRRRAALAGLALTFALSSSPVAAGELTMVRLPPPAAPAAGSSYAQRASTTATAQPVWTSWQIGAMIRAVTAHGDDVWIGTTAGLLRYNRKADSHTLYTTKQGLMSDIILAIRVDPKGQVWIGTYGGGLSRLNPQGPAEHQFVNYTPFGVGDTRYGKHWSSFKPGEGIGDLWVYDLLFEPDGTMWAATWKGASRFDGKRFRTLTTADGLVDKWVYTLQRAPSGVFWFGTEGGVTRYQPAGATARWKSWTHNDGIGAASARPAEGATSAPYSPIVPHHETGAKTAAGYNPNYIITSALDREGRLWVGTWGAGLSRFDGRQWKNYTTREGLSGNHVNSLALDRNGSLWIGTNGGVTQFDPVSGKTTNYRQEDGLLGIPIYSVAVDPSGGRWFGTIGGITHVAQP